jgi:hypothetical protein
MSKNQKPRITRRCAARMLRGAQVTVPVELVGLLAAAAAPPHDGELTGESTAVAAFVAAAHRASVPGPRSRSMIHSTLAKVLTLKVAAAAAAICTLGGVATAAATGHLVPPSHGSPPSPSGHTSAGESGTRGGTSTPRGSSAGHSASPSPSLLGLCHAYTSEAGSAHGKALDNPAFTTLITSAGGRTKVDAYCAAVLGAKASATQGAGSPAAGSDPGRSAAGHEAATDHPTGPPTTHPTGAPTTHRTGTPRTHPTGAPTTHPTGAATAHPTGAHAAH